MAVRWCVCLLFVIHMSAGIAPKIKLNDGREMPTIALGTYLGFDEDGVISPTDEYVDVISRSITLGWRHFDTSCVYKTESAVGEGLRRKIRDGTVKREDIFVTTKLWNTHHEREKVTQALNKTLDDMGLDYIDLFLMHWPMGHHENYTDCSVDYLDTWEAMEKVRNYGMVKSIGVSNFNLNQLKRLVTDGYIPPAVLQIENHPQLSQKELVAYAQSQGIVVMGYSPLGSLISGLGPPGGPRFDSPDLVALADKYAKSVPQILLRWLVERNIVPVVKTTTLSRLAQNICIFNFKLEKEEIDKISAYENNTRFNLPSFWQNHPHYPYEKVEKPIADPFKTI